MTFSVVITYYTNNFVQKKSNKLKLAYSELILVRKISCDSAAVLCASQTGNINNPTLSSFSVQCATLQSGFKSDT